MAGRTALYFPISEPSQGAPPLEKQQPLRNLLKALRPLRSSGKCPALRGRAFSLVVGFVCVLGVLGYFFRGDITIHHGLKVSI